MFAIYEIPEGPPPKNLPEWFGVFDYPINSMTYEDVQDPEMVEAIVEDLADTAELIRKLRADGWQLGIDWGPDEATYQVTHHAYQSAAKANARLAELEIRRFKCFDTAYLRDLFGG